MWRFRKDVTLTRHGNQITKSHYWFENTPQKETGPIRDGEKVPPNPKYISKQILRGSKKKKKRYITQKRKIIPRSGSWNQKESKNTKSQKNISVRSDSLSNNLWLHRSILITFTGANTPRYKTFEYLSCMYWCQMHTINLYRTSYSLDHKSHLRLELEAKN